MADPVRVDVVVIGAGLAGLVTPLELLESGDQRILLVDRCAPHEVGGLAREAEVLSCALLPRGQLGRTRRVRRWQLGSRFHLTWGCGQALVDAMWGAIGRRPRRSNLEVRFGTRVTELRQDGSAVAGCRMVLEKEGTEETDVAARAIVIAAGGVGGNLDIVRREWPSELGAPPAEILMGSRYYADGALHEEVKRIGGNVTNISRMWNYADAVRHPQPRRPLHGLKLIPPRSGLVVDPTGRRYGPAALIPTFDAYHALQRMCEDRRGYYWMICNWKIARRELDVSALSTTPAFARSA